MCGVLVCNDPKITRQQFDQALSLLHHRGPDARASQLVNGTFLGHSRLKVIDLDDQANQPFRSADGRHLIVFNGEIYNFRELAKHHQLRTRTDSDTEVLLELYLKLGWKMLSELNGMFAFVILDTQTGALFAARDRLGIKPLYVVRKGSAISFCSEIAPLLALGVAGNELDEVGVRQYRKLRNYFNGRTIYKDISMMAAGHYFADGHFQRYWQFPDKDDVSPTDEELRWLLESAVEYRCIADVPVGSFLSGGLDSSIISGIARKPHTWTVGFADNNEFLWSDMVAQQQHNTHHKVVMSDEEFLPILEWLIAQRKEPLLVPNEVMLYRMSKELKRYNTVVLSGEGADELMFGYDRIFRWAEENPWDIREFDRLYCYGRHRDDEIIEDAMAPFLEYGSNQKNLAAFFQVAHLHGLLRRLDFATMMNSVETRVPFVDHRLVERMAGVPFAYRLQDGVVKAALKRVFRQHLPQPVIDREKVGFPVNLGKFFSNPEGGSPMEQWFQFNLERLSEVNR